MQEFDFYYVRSNNNATKTKERRYMYLVRFATGYIGWVENPVYATPFSDIKNAECHLQLLANHTPEPIKSHTYEVVRFRGEMTTITCWVFNPAKMVEATKNVI